MSQTTIAIFDNKINIDHSYIKDKIYINKSEFLNSKDDDANGYIDDLIGWNFTENQTHSFNSHAPIKFSNELFDYYELKSKKYLNTISKTEEEIYKNYLKDSELMDSKKQFTKYAHGTHIACIALGINDPSNKENIKILPITYLANESNSEDDDFQSHPDFELKKFSKSNYTDEALKIGHIKNYLHYYLNWLISKFHTSITYSKQFSPIINASWGQSFKSSLKLVQKIYKEEFDREIDEELNNKIAKEFMQNLLLSGKQLLSKHSDVLFVFSAGNTNSNNDEIPHYPSGIKLSNTLSIGAILNNQKASFSNFGKKSVDLFFDGVAINSCTPDGELVKINGTSQAAAGVSYAAAVIWELLKKQNKKPSAKFVKSLLIKTSIKEESLKELSIYSGKVSLENIRLKLSN